MVDFVVTSATGMTCDCHGSPPSEKELSIEIQRECAAVRSQATHLETVFRGVTLDHPGFRVLKRIGVRSYQSQGHYGANSAVFEADFNGKRCALKGIICAYGPFKKTQESLLNEAVRDELRQPPHSPYLLRYWKQFNAVVSGDMLQDWPLDVQTTPRDSLTKWFVMPLLSHGNLQTWVRTHPLTNEMTLLGLIVQVLKGVAVLVQHNLLHRDLKLDNILVYAAEHAMPRLMIADFGCMISMDDVDGPAIGNPQHTAPELRATLAPSDLTRAEVWASGVLCFDIADSDPPYEKGDNRFLNVACVSERAAGVIERMLEWEPSRRPSPLQAATELQQLRATEVMPVASLVTMPAAGSSGNFPCQCPASPSLPLSPGVSGHSMTLAAQPFEPSTQTCAPLGTSSQTPSISIGVNALRRAPGAASLPTLAVVEGSADLQVAACSAELQSVVDVGTPPSPDVSAHRLGSSLSERRLRFMAQGLANAAVGDSDSGARSLHGVSSAQNLHATTQPPSSHISAQSDLVLDVRPSPDASLPRLGSSLSARRLLYGSRMCTVSVAARPAAHMARVPAESRTAALHVQVSVPPPPSPSVNRLGASLSASRLRFLSQSPGQGDLSSTQTVPASPESSANSRGISSGSCTRAESPVLQVSTVAASGAVLDPRGDCSVVPKPHVANSPNKSPTRLRSSLSVRRLRFSPEVIGSEQYIRCGQTILPSQQVGQQQACVLDSAAFVAEVPPLPFFPASRSEVT